MCLFLPARAAEHPKTLMSAYAAPDDHVRTLHDCVENSIAKYPYVSLHLHHYLMRNVI